MRTDPEQDSTPEPGSRVGVFVSNAVEVPSVVGRQTKKAVRILREAGFKVEAEKSRGPVSFVIEQSPDGGTLAEPGSTVTLSVIP